MGDLLNNIKKITSNKNTVTVLGVILGIFIIYIAYTSSVNAAISTTSVPYAAELISPGTQITEAMIGTRKVPKSMLKGKVITNYYSVLNKYSSINSVIPLGSLFYENTIVEKNPKEQNQLLDYPNGYVLYYMSVNTATTYGNSFYPGNYIDIYLKAVNKVYDETQVTADDNKIMLGKFIQNVKILAVKDEAGNDVFKNLDEKATPSMIVFAVPEEYYILLKKSEYLSTYDSTLIPVPTNESLKDKPGSLKIASETLKDWINKVTIWTQN